MSTESAQVMRVLDRYLDAAGPGSDPGRGVAAAAAWAKDDPCVHVALSRLLVEECPATSRESWRCGLTLLRERESSDVPQVTEHCDADSSLILLLSRCKAASRAAGEQDSSTAAALAEALLAVVAVERSSLGTDRGRRLRNQAAHLGVASVRTRWRTPAGAGQPENRPQSGPELGQT